MTQGNIEFYFFCHDPASRRVLDAVETSSAVTILDLNELSVPPEWLDYGLDGETLNAALSEYLGHIHIEPRLQLVGVFPYSVFTKFTRVWALQANDRARFLPEITPRVILESDYDLHSLSYAEMQRGTAIWDYLGDYPDVQKKLVSVFGDPAKVPYRFPLKGSFVLSSDRFAEYQSWLRETIPIVLQEFGRTSLDGVNPYSGSKGFPEERRRQQNCRFLIGGIVERLAGAFVARQYRRLPGRRIGAPAESVTLRSPVEVAETVKDAAGNVVVVFADADYGAVLDNWLVAIARLQDVPFFVCALDKKLYRQLKREGVPVVHVPRRPAAPGARPRASLWALRVEIVAELVARGFNVLLSDIDAIWLHDPLPYLAGLEGSIIASQGTTWPKEASDAWQFVLCNGFVQFRSDAFSLSVLARMKRESTENQGRYDDQASLNRVLLNAHIRWDIKSRYTLDHDNRKLLCSREPIIGSISRASESDPDGQVVVIPHTVVQRVSNAVEESSAVLVRHPLSKRGAQAVMSALAENDLWFIPPPPSPTG